MTLIYFPPKNATPARSNLVSIPPGCVPSDMLYSSPIISENAGGNMDASFGFGAGGAPGATAGGGAGGGGADDFGGVDPNMDPELAMALRVSMEEERQRQAIGGQMAALRQESRAAALAAAKKYDEAMDEWSGKYQKQREEIHKLRDVVRQVCVPYPSFGSSPHLDEPCLLLFAVH